MKPYRVRYWHDDEDGSLDGMAELREWNEKWKRWWTMQDPEFEI